MATAPISRRYARGGDLSKVPLTANTPPADLAKILNVDSANPFLRQVRIQQGYLRAGDLAAELIDRAAERAPSPGERQ